ncbi:hypothetical protein [Paraburkholderia sp.]|uniref:hypothetical protein n=1 Tax=Paraburkholderia sp. TaxID=1926495 RepID=UPI003C799350
MTDHSQMKLGKRAPVVDPHVPHLFQHMMAMKPSPAVDWTKAVDSWPMLANDQVGDCTCAAVYHQIQCWTANNGSSWKPTDAETLALYGAITGYPKQDTGAVEMDVLKYWHSVGVPGDNTVDKVSFCHLFQQNLDEIRLSIEFFGGAYLGFALPLSAQTQDVWDVTPAGNTGAGAPGSWGGHAIIAVAYGPDGFTIVTWGALKKVTNAFMAAYCEEAYGVVSYEWLAKSGISPPGLDWSALMRDLAAITD